MLRLETRLAAPDTVGMKPDEEWPELAAARDALHAMCVRRVDFVATGMNADALAAARIASVAVDLLGGNGLNRPEALTQLRRMQEALEKTSLDILEFEVSSAAEQQRAATKPATKLALLRRFVCRIGPHLEVLGIARHRLPADMCGPALSRWRARPNRRRGELSARGVLIALLVVAGDDEQNATKRVIRHTPKHL